MMHQRELGVIDPSQIEKLAVEDRALLAKYLAHSKKSILPMLSEHVTCSGNGWSTIEADSVIFSVKYDLLRRSRKNNKPGIRFEVYDSRDKPIGRGGLGVVYHSLGVLILEDAELRFKSKFRALKKQSTRHAESEYNIAKEVEHLHMKPPVQVSENTDQKKAASFLVMRFLPGFNLQRIIEDEEKKLLEINTTQRLQLSLKILQKIHEQVHMHNIVHRDIKPGNIMIDLASNSVNIIDYEKGKKLLEASQYPSLSGTLLTMPQEQFRDCDEGIPKYTVQTDSYAVGKTLALFWGAARLVDERQTKSNLELYNLCFFRSKHDAKYNRYNFFSNDLHAMHASQVEVMLEQLTRAHPDQRWPLSAAIELLEKILQERSELSMKMKL